MDLLKQEKGSITLFVVISMLFFAMFLTGMYMLSATAESGVIEEQARIKEIYEQGVNDIDNVYATLDNEFSTIKISNPIENLKTREGNELQFTWEEIAEIAENVSNNIKVTNNTQEFTLTYKKNRCTIGVGDYTTLNGKKVRILGFNHDKLTSNDAYGTGKNNTYAGISFEFVDFITNEAINSTDINSGGWGECKLRGTLNSTIIDELENKKYIKEVRKDYIETYNDPASVTISNDKLWLLSCSEVWDNGYEDGYGYASAKEGRQYKYYNTINAMYNSNNAKLIKNSYDWYLRSPHYNSSITFCFIHASGSCHSSFYRS